MTDYCNECDSMVAESTKFCPECGAKTPEQLAKETIPSQAKHYVGEAADELYGAAKDAYQSGKHLASKDTAKKVAGGAAIGAAASIIAPVGLAAGAAIGAGVVAYRHINKKKQQEEDGQK